MKVIYCYIAVLIAVSYGVLSQQLIHFDNNVNTNEDEFLPFIYNNNLIFGRTYKLETIPISQYSIKSIEFLSIENNNKINEINIGFKPNKITDNLNSVNFRFNMIRKRYINSRNSIFSKVRYFYNFHPAISPDSLYIVFVSDELETNISSRKNTTDLYITFKLANGKWSEPYNLGNEINSVENEITPFIDNNHNLYFARKVLKNNNWNYDIFVAKSIGNGKWANPVALPSPVNTQFNETGAFVKGDTILFASDRIPKTNKSLERNYDIYCFIKQKSNKISINLKKERKSSKKIEFFNYEIPFFVTGYYYPNTPENLEKLRLKFEKGIYGNNPLLRYIENPDNEAWDYDASSLLVEKALEQACIQIANELQSLDDDNCPVFLTFTGYSDSRKIIDNQIYCDEQIKSFNPYLFVEKGETMNNVLLSKLRAYFTALEVKKRLRDSPIFNKYKNRIIFIVKGNGTVDDKQIPPYRQRRVEITLKIDSRKKVDIDSLPPLEKQGIGMITE